MKRGSFFRLEGLESYFKGPNEVLMKTQSHAQGLLLCCFPEKWSEIFVFVFFDRQLFSALFPP